MGVESGNRTGDVIRQGRVWRVVRDGGALTEGLDAGHRAAEDEGVDIEGACVGVHDFKVDEGAGGAEFGCGGRASRAGAQNHRPDLR